VDSKTADDLTLDLVLRLNDYDSIDAAATQAQHAEDCGFSLVTAGETTGWNIGPVLAVIADRTSTIQVADDVLSPYSRAPTVLGQTALTMHDVTGGRFRLGLGTSSPALAEQWHGHSFERPLRRLRETIDIVRTVYEGGVVEYDGDISDVGGLRYERAVPEDPPAIDVAALGPTSVELAGRFADGWVPQLFTQDGLRERLDDLARGAKLGDRSVDDIRVNPVVRCSAHEDGEYARSLARKTVSFLIGAYGPYYGNSVAAQGYEDTVETIRAAWDDRDRKRMAAALPDDLLDALAAAETPEMVRSKIESFGRIDGVDAVRVGFVSEMSQGEKEQTVEALAPLTGTQ
jgi:coenzyme F420-dependent oxidoreductase